MKSKRRLKKVQKNRKYLDDELYEEVTDRWLKIIEEEKKRNKAEITSILDELNKLGLTDEMIDNLIVSNVFVRQKEQYYRRYLDFKTIVVFLVLSVIQ